MREDHLKTHNARHNMLHVKHIQTIKNDLDKRAKLEIDNVRDNGIPN